MADLQRADDVTALDTPQKRLLALREALEGSVRLVVRAAAILHAMVSAGDDVSALPTTTRKWLLLIHARQMLPEVFTEMSGVMRDRVSRLPLPQQARLLAGERVPMLIISSGGYDELKVDIRKLSPDQIKQVLTNSGTVRDTEEQRAYLEDMKLKARKVVTPTSDVKIDKRRGGIVVAGVFLSASDMARYLASLTG